MTSLDNYKIILGSQSPRRHQLMKDAGFKFKVVVPSINEDFDPSMNIEIVPEFLSKKKAKRIGELADVDDQTFVVTADTVVLLNGELLGKPKSLEEAKRMLHQLSGNKHTVVSGITILKGSQEFSFSESTHVFFNKLSDQEISFFVDNYMPLDKAGAYAIQEWIGFVGINKIEGCYYNVMGLPINKVYQAIVNWE